MSGTFSTPSTPIFVATVAPPSDGGPSLPVLVRPVEGAVRGDANVPVSPRTRNYFPQVRVTRPADGAPTLSEIVARYCFGDDE